LRLVSVLVGAPSLTANGLASAWAPRST